MVYFTTMFDLYILNLLLKLPFIYWIYSQIIWLFPMVEWFWHFYNYNCVLGFLPPWRWLHKWPKLVGRYPLIKLPQNTIVHLLVLILYSFDYGMEYEPYTIGHCCFHLQSHSHFPTNFWWPLSVPSHRKLP